MAFALVSLAFGALMLYRNSLSDDAAGTISAMMGDPNQALPKSVTLHFSGYSQICPETALPLSLAALPMVSLLDAAVTRGLEDLGGRKVERWPDMLVRIDGKRVYRARMNGPLRAQDGVVWPPQPPQGSR